MTQVFQQVCTSSWKHQGNYVLSYEGAKNKQLSGSAVFVRNSNSNIHNTIKTHDSESRGQEEAQQRDH